MAPRTSPPGRIGRATATGLVAVLLAVAAPTVTAGASPAAPPPVLERLAGLPAATATRSAAVRTPIPFSLVGFELPAADATVRFRTSRDGRTWSGWTLAEPMDEAPDPGTAEAAAARPASAPVWVGEARYLQVATDGTRPDRVPVHLVDGLGLSRSLPARLLDRARGAVVAAAPAAPAVAATTQPPVVSRAGWGADESLRSGSPSYATARYGVVHHTATRNEYSREEAPAIVRSIYAYHTRTLGWSDIGYNFLVDRFGTIYEGRAGGLTKGVVGAHAAGFNTGSIGVSVVGTYTSAPPPRVALDAVEHLLAWKQAVHGIDPAAIIKVTSKGSNKYPKGTTIEIPTTIAHRDVGKTSCPGDAFYRHMPGMREALRNGTTGTAPGATDPPPEPAPSETLPPPVPPLPPLPFTDVEGSVHAGSIEAMWRDGVVAGCSEDRYCPDEPVTRAQMASLLARVRGLEPVGGQRFTDVPADHAHAGAVNAVAAAGIATGYADGTFRPEQSLTRAEMAVMLHRALGLPLVWGQRFVDLPMEEVYVRPRVNAVAQAGVASGCASDRFCPAHAVSRGQMATFLHRTE